MRTLHWSPSTGLYHWIKNAGISEGFESSGAAIANRADVTEYPYGQFKNLILLTPVPNAIETKDGVETDVRNIGAIMEIHDLNEHRKRNLCIADEIYQEYIAHNAATKGMTGRVHYRRWIENELAELEEK